MLIKIVKVIALLLGLLLLIFIIANAKDDELRPEVKEALNWQIPADALDIDNGYVLLHGMYAPIGQDPYLAGKAILENELARYQEFQKTKIEPLYQEQNDKNPFTDWRDRQSSNPETKNTVDYYLKQDAASIAVLTVSLKPLTDRFAALKKSKKFVEVIPPLVTFILPRYSHLTQAFEFERILSVHDISEGRIEIGIQRLAENNLFARRLLANADSLVTNMIAVSMLQKDVRLASELLAKYPETATYIKEFQIILKPIATAEYSLKKTMIFERRLILAMTNSISYQMHNSDSKIANIASKLLAKLFYLPNAMLNRYYDFGELRISVADIDAFNLDRVTAQHTEKRKSLLGFGNEYIYLRDPIGKTLVGQSDDSLYSSYFERHHDLDGYITLVRLQHKLIADKVTNDRLPYILPQYPNPYTLEPMRLDTQNGFIVFDGRQPSNSNFNKSSSYQIAMPQ